MRSRKRRPFLRRRVLRPFRRPLARQTKLHPKLMRALQNANRLLDQGQFAEAGQAFHDLALKADHRGTPLAANLYLQSGRVWLRADKVDHSLECFRKALSILAFQGQYPRLERLGHLALQELKQHGKGLASQQIQEHLNQLLKGVEFHSWREPRTILKLPPKCPYCGGNVNPQELEWVDPSGALCEYCGSMIEGSGTT